MQRLGSIRNIGQYTNDLHRPHNMTLEQAALVEERRRAEGPRVNAVS